jgi:tRNA(adenine34) deaminase
MDASGVGAARLTPMLSDDDTRLLRAAIALSWRAREAGNQPYGAVLADAQGQVLAEGVNTQVTSADCTAHAEINLVRDVSTRISRETLARCTVYASGEPCAMCAGAIYWAGIGRIVYALSIETMTALAGDAADELALHCRNVLRSGTRVTTVIGPALQAEARRVFESGPGGPNP